MNKVIVKDRGWRRIRMNIKDMGYIHVDVGIQDDAPPYNKDGKSVPLPKVAIWNEYGTEDAPARPFMRKTARDSLLDLRELVARCVDMVIRGNTTARGAMQRVGNFYKKAIIATIDSSPSWAVPNALRTIAKKGSAHPLIDTEHMKSHISFKMRGKK